MEAASIEAGCAVHLTCIVSQLPAAGTPNSPVVSLEQWWNHSAKEDAAILSQIPFYQTTDQLNTPNIRSIDMVQ